MANFEIRMRHLVIAGLVLSTQFAGHIAAQQTPVPAGRAGSANMLAPVLKADLDFEDQLQGWTKTGTVFDSQPADGGSIRTDDAIMVPIGGDYWRGLPYPLGHHGRFLIRTGDAPVGMLTSAEFPLSRVSPYFSFLIGGSQDLAHERLELQVLAAPAEASELERRIAAWVASLPSSPLLGGVQLRDGDYLVVVGATGHGRELLRHEKIPIPDFLLGRTARLRIVDDSQYGHINVDFIQFTSTQPAPYHGKVWGFADYHTHPMAHMGFGGLKEVRTLWGVPGRAYNMYVGTHPSRHVSDDIPPCVKGHRGGPTAEVFINTAEQRLRLGSFLRNLWSWLSGGLSRHKRSAGPKFENFPTFLSGAHQQMHITQIRRAYDGGLRLMVAFATHNAGVEYVVSKVENGRVFPMTRDKEVLKAQVCGMRQLVQYNSDWMEIAYTPDQARQIISRGDLAVILGIEMDQLGKLGDHNPETDGSSQPGFHSLEEEVDYLWRLGIRQAIPIHSVDNRLGGPAVFQDVYNSESDFLNRGQLNVSPKDLPWWPERFFDVREGGCSKGPLAGQRGECVMFHLDEKQNRAVITSMPFLSLWQLAPFISAVPVYRYQGLEGHMNQLGLTSDGQQYILELMKRGMLIDLAHMSHRSVENVFEVIGKELQARHGPDCVDFPFDPNLPELCYREAYPLTMSHVNFRALSIHDRKTTRVKGFLPQEYDLSERHADVLRHVGGVIGPFVTQHPLDPPLITPKRSGQPSGQPQNQLSVPFLNDCAMSSKGFGYAFLYGLHKMDGFGVGLATDFNFIPQVAPRFGRNACWAYNLATDPKKEKLRSPMQYRIKKQRRKVSYVDCETPLAGFRIGNNEALCLFRMDKRRFDFNEDGLAHYGLIPDLLQDLKNLGMKSEDFASLFSSAEAYLLMWEKAQRISGCDPSNPRCQFKPSILNCVKACRDMCPESSNAGAPKTRR